MSKIYHNVLYTDTEILVQQNTTRTLALIVDIYSHENKYGYLILTTFRLAPIHVY